MKLKLPEKGFWKILENAVMDFDQKMIKDMDNSQIYLFWTKYSFWMSNIISEKQIKILVEVSEKHYIYIGLT